LICCVAPQKINPEFLNNPNVPEEHRHEIKKDLDLMTGKTKMKASLQGDGQEKLDCEGDDGRKKEDGCKKN
jgi:hypothetical protein